MGGDSFGVGPQSDVWYSTDGANWTQATASAEWSIRNYPGLEVFDSKMWIIGGNSTNDVWQTAPTP